MSITINGVTCEVISTGYEEHADQSGQGATRGYLCDWDQRFIVAHGLLGLVNYTGTASSGSVSFVDPLGLDELPLMRAMSVRIEGKGQPTQNAAGLGYTYAIVWAQYGIFPYSPGSGGDAQISPDDSFIYCTQEIDVSKEYVEIPGQALTLDDGTPALIPFNRDLSISYSVVEMTLQFHRLPYIPMPVLAHTDKVNDALFLGIEKGKVRFDGIKVSRDYGSTDGRVLQKATFHFSYRPVADWNKVPDPRGNGNWITIKYKSATVYPYPYYDLRAVWPVGYYNSL